MTALRSCERQSDGCSPTAQIPSKQEFGKALRRHPLSLPRFPAGNGSYSCQPRLYQDLLNYLQYSAFLRYVKQEIPKQCNILPFCKKEQLFRGKYAEFGKNAVTLCRTPRRESGASSATTSHGQLSPPQGSAMSPLSRRPHL